MVRRLTRLVVVQAGVLAVLTVNLWSQEAPQSFVSQNGSLSQRQFDVARKAFEEIETPEKGLGIHFNEASCAICHVSPGAKVCREGVVPSLKFVQDSWASTTSFFLRPGVRL
jgi:hypothetical protein